uniref:Death domain-containing protein n=1 Tax=Amphimedon queenslandica TaxID=400682 RepID=A0A1X7UG56_AMPQE
MQIIWRGGIYGIRNDPSGVKSAVASCTAGVGSVYLNRSVGTIMAMCSPPPTARPTAPRLLLQINDLADLLELLCKHGYSGVTYYDLGLYLGLSPVTLDVIEKNNERDVQICLRECLKIWLQKADDVDKKGGPTIHSLISALKKVKEKAVADGIDMERHPACKILSNYTSRLSQVLVSLWPSLAPLLHSESLIKNEISRKDDILIEVQEAVCLDFYKLEVFAVILLRYTATAELGKSIMKEYRNCYCENDLIKVDKSTDKVGLKIYLPQSLTKSFKSMRLKYGDTFFTVESIMMKYSPAIVDKMKQLLNFYDTELKHSLTQCQKIREILEIVCDKCSLNDIEILEFIVNKLNINEAKLVVQEYNEAIKEFSKMKLSQCLMEQFSYGSLLSCEKVTIVVDQDAADSTLKDVRRLSGEIFRDLVPQIKLCVIRDDQSFTVICSFPLSLTEQLIAIALESIEILKENKVKRLTIGYCIVYEIEEMKEQQHSGTGTLKQLVLSQSIQLLNSKDEIKTLEKNLSNEKEARQFLEVKSKVLKAQGFENQSLQKSVTELKEENAALKEINQLLEEQLALFQSEKEGIKQPKKSPERDKEIEVLQNKISSISIQKIEKDEVLNNMAEENKRLKLMIDEISQSLETDSRDEEIKFLTQQLEITKTEKKELENLLAESKKEIELLLDKISTISVLKISPKERI